MTTLRNKELFSISTHQPNHPDPDGTVSAAYAGVTRWDPFYSAGTVTSFVTFRRKCAPG